MIKIPLTQGQFTLIDDEDLERISQFKWHVRKVRGKLYAGTGKYLGKIDDKYVTKTVHLHRFVLDLKDDNLQVDHINGDGLDNRKENLRISSPSENRRNLVKLKNNNTSGYRGVTKIRNRYRARISDKNGNKVHLGYFDSPEEAAKAFDKAAKESYGEFCGKLNFEVSDD